MPLILLMIHINFEYRVYKPYQIKYNVIIVCEI